MQKVHNTSPCVYINVYLVSLNAIWPLSTLFPVVSSSPLQCRKYEKINVLPMQTIDEWEHDNVELDILTGSPLSPGFPDVP